MIRISIILTFVSQVSTNPQCFLLSDCCEYLRIALPQNFTSGLISYGFSAQTDYSEDSESHIDTMTVTTSALSVLLVLAVGYIVYLKRSDIRCWNQGNSSARESVSGVNVADLA